MFGCALLLPVSLLLSMDPAEIAKARALEENAAKALSAGRLADAVTNQQQAVALWKAGGPEAEPPLIHAQMELALTYRQQGAPDKAIPLLEGAVTWLSASKDPNAKQGLPVALQTWRARTSPFGGRRTRARRG